MDIDFEKTAGVDLEFPENRKSTETSYKVRFEPVSEDPREDPSKAYPNYKLHVIKLATVAVIVVAGMTALAVTLTVTRKDSEPEIVPDYNNMTNMTSTTSLTTTEQTILSTSSSDSTSTEDTTTTTMTEETTQNK